MVTDGVQQSMASPTTYDALACLDGTPDCYKAGGYPANTATANLTEPTVASQFTDGTAEGQIRWRHLGNQGANFLFVDQHVESLLTSQLKKGNLYYDP